MKVRRAGPNDVVHLARLHELRINEGFLATLGQRFLQRLYGRVVRSPDAFAFVGEDCGRVVGFVAAATDVRRLYRSFVLRDGAVAAVVAAPRLARSWRRSLETLRYPGATGALPAAEILAVAVDVAATRQGIGAALVDAATAELARRGVGSAKVVAGAANGPALALYARCRFSSRARIELHEGASSEVLVWSSS